VERRLVGRCGILPCVFGVSIILRDQDFEKGEMCDDRDSSGRGINYGKN